MIENLVGNSTAPLNTHIIIHFLMKHECITILNEYCRHLKKIELHHET